MKNNYLQNMVLRLYHYILYYPKWAVADMLISTRSGKIYHKNDDSYNNDWAKANSATVEEYFTKTNEDDLQ